MSKAERKAQYFEKLLGYLEEYPKVFVVGCDNVGSNQMQQVRIALRGKAEILMGKNTLIRKALRGLAAEQPDIAKLMHVVRGNVGFVFTKGDLCEIRDTLHSFKVSAPARAGGVAPTDVIVPAGNTGMGPEKTQFFQALNIQTKITKGTVEIVNNVPLIKAGDKVGASEATLLNMLNISPFAYALTVQHVYDNGSLYEPHVLDIKDSDLLARFMSGISNVAAVSLAIGYPTVAAVPHMIVNGYKNVLAIALATDITFPLAEKAKAFLADPEAALAALAAAAPVAAAAPAAGAAAAAPEPEPEPEEEEEDMGFDLFG